MEIEASSFLFFSVDLDRETDSKVVIRCQRPDRGRRARKEGERGTEKERDANGVLSIKTLDLPERRKNGKLIFLCLLFLFTIKVLVKLCSLSLSLFLLCACFYEFAEGGGVEMRKVFKKKLRACSVVVIFGFFSFPQNR